MCTLVIITMPADCLAPSCDRTSTGRVMTMFEPRIQMGLGVLDGLITADWWNLARYHVISLKENAYNKIPLQVDQLIHFGSNRTNICIYIYIWINSYSKYSRYGMSVGMLVAYFTNRDLLAFGTWIYDVIVMHRMVFSCHTIDHVISMDTSI